MIYTFLTRKSDGFCNQRVIMDIEDSEALVKTIAVGLFKAEKNAVCEIYADRIPKGDCYGTPQFYLYKIDQGDNNEQEVFDLTNMRKQHK
jgi:hypothetical protein